MWVGVGMYVCGGGGDMQMLKNSGKDADLTLCVA